MPVDIQLAARIIDFFNELLELDRMTITKLIEHREVPNEALVNHPTVQVTTEDLSTAKHRVGFLGILNGLCGTYDEEPLKGWGPIAIEMPTLDVIKRFRLTRPCIHYGPPPELETVAIDVGGCFPTAVAEPPKDCDKTSEEDE
jgi:hypothetical protein